MDGNDNNILGTNPINVPPLGKDSTIQGHTCHICGKVLKNLPGLRRHITTIHEKPAQKMELERKAAGITEPIPEPKKEIPKEETKEPPKEDLKEPPKEDQKETSKPDSKETTDTVLTNTGCGAVSPQEVDKFIKSEKDKVFTESAKIAEVKNTAAIKKATNSYLSEVFCRALAVVTNAYESTHAKIKGLTNRIINTRKDVYEKDMSDIITYYELDNMGFGEVNPLVKLGLDLLQDIVGVVGENATIEPKKEIPKPIKPPEPKSEPNPPKLEIPLIIEPPIAPKVSNKELKEKMLLLGL